MSVPFRGASYFTRGFHFQVYSRRQTITLRSIQGHVNPTLSYPKASSCRRVWVSFVLVSVRSRTRVLYRGRVVHMLLFTMASTSFKRITPFYKAVFRTSSVVSFLKFVGAGTWRVNYYRCRGAFRHVQYVHSGGQLFRFFTRHFWSLGGVLVQYGNADNGHYHPPSG